MARHLWDKFFWTDWQSDPLLAMCSYAARGVWMECLGVMSQAEPKGYLLVNGQPPDERALLTLTRGKSLSELRRCLEELERHGVYSKTPAGVVYSRRMVRDVARAERNARNGARGGNPDLLDIRDLHDRISEPDNRPPNPQKQKPEAEARSREEPPPTPSALMDLWNAITLRPIPVCRELTDRRQRRAQQRLRERSIDVWRAVIERIVQSDFCKGVNDRGWVASFDWLLQPDVAVKVLEGKYDNRASVAHGKPRTAAETTLHTLRKMEADDALHG